MKTVLVIAAVLGLSSTAALAECAGHVTASAKVDKEITTASIAAPKMDPREEAVVLKQSEGQAKVTE
ncbi:hypothetical protein [Neorhizobium galegae]|uniref:hypothetical protein n=1 Tax=Neorhizobium galegae TaxID=399 RepID=UPI0006211E8F|nr:hypothetical protein [Neorhizobium galegae]CDZ61636.1 Hypothetical protein NGAL_HAMBI2605_15800 [Neorhizobium galegae bv. orientalis]MCQ1573824.1 hypothetical protein [Neorhizobium galegae]MCQ1834798.1 hypothetical protein [Neorhizobium galegae]UIK05707.1 hypothetical protein LZK81_01485 [Neorhizobium galegae]UIY29724.1 hypothetical protein LZK73_02200 [Neorhizobium galegae]